MSAPKHTPDASERLATQASALLATLNGYFSAQRTIDDGGYHDNYTDVARARDERAMLLVAMQTALARADFGDLAALRAQRDEMLAALKDCCNWVQNPYSVERLQKIIAKAEGRT